MVVAQNDLKGLSRSLLRSCSSDSPGPSISGFSVLHSLQVGGPDLYGEDRMQGAALSRMQMVS